MIDRFAIIVGAMKAGTSSLFAHLAQHSQVCPSTPKEPNFFANDENWAKGLAWYEGLWDWKPAIHKIALEASTNYTKIPGFPNAAERMSQVPRSFRLIYLMRDPIRRIESQYNHGPKDRGWSPPDVDEARQRRHIVDVTRYAMQISEYYKRFESDQILLLAFEDLVSDPLAVVQRVCRFLDIDPDYRFKSLHQPRNVSNEIDHPIYKLASNSSILRALARVMPARHREFARSLLASKTANLVRLSERQRQFFLSALKDDLARLTREYGFDVSRWNIEA